MEARRQSQYFEMSRAWRERGEEGGSCIHVRSPNLPQLQGATEHDAVCEAELPCVCGWGTGDTLWGHCGACPAALTLAVRPQRCQSCLASGCPQSEALFGDIHRIALHPCARETVSDTTPVYTALSPNSKFRLQLSAEPVTAAELATFGFPTLSHCGGPCGAAGS